MNRKRPKQVVIRMSEEEYATMKRKVEQSGMKQQEYLIKAITNKPITNTDGIKEIYPELKRQGTNLNQIAKVLNEKGYYDFKALSSALKELENVWQLLKQYLQKQG